MLETSAIILLILWLFGMVSGLTFGGWGHLLLVAAIVMLLYKVCWIGLDRPRPSKPPALPDCDPLMEECVRRAFESGNMVIGNRDEKGVTITEHKLKK